MQKFQTISIIGCFSVIDKVKTYHPSCGQGAKPCGCQTAEPRWRPRGKANGNYEISAYLCLGEQLCLWVVYFEYKNLLKTLVGSRAKSVGGQEVKPPETLKL